MFSKLSNTLDFESRQLLEQSYNASFAACELHEKANGTADSLNGEIVSDSELAAAVSTIASPEAKKLIAKKRKNLAQRFR